MLDELHGGGVIEAYRTEPIRVEIHTSGAEAASINDRLQVQPADGRTSMLLMNLQDNIRERGIDYLNVLINLYFEKSLQNITLFRNAGAYFHK